MRLIDDLIDLACLRARPLAEYRHPAWQLLCALLILSVINSASAENFTGPLPARLGFFAVFALLESVLVTAVLTLWLRLSGWRERDSLWPLVVLSSGVQALEPLTSWLGEAAGQTLSGLLAVYSILVLVLGVARATGMPAWRVAAGVVMFLPLGAMLLAVMLGAAADMGWVTLPVAPADAN